MSTDDHGNASDVFVSYAHADNRKPEGAHALYGWVTTLTENLKALPAARKKVFYIDHALLPGDTFPNELLDKVAKSSVLLLVLSQNYIDSKWCGRELDHFIQRRGDDPNKPRNVVVVELAPFENYKNAPSAILSARKELIHAKFWHKPADAANTVILGYPSPSESVEQSHYWQRLSELGAALDSRLDAAASSAPRPRLALQRGHKATVLLADVTEDLESQRQLVKTALDKEGITVLPEGDYVGLTHEEFVEAFRKDLQASTLFVQLLSKTKGRVPKGFPGPFPQLQYRGAAESGIGVMQWCEAIPTADEALDDAHAALFRTRFIRETHREAFTDEVLARLIALAAIESAKERDAADSADSERRVVFVDDCFGDPVLGTQIRAIIKGERCDIRSWPRELPLDGDSDTAREKLRMCRGGLTVFADRRDHHIVHSRLVFFLNQVAEARIQLSRWGIYFGPPPDKGDVISDFGIDSQDVIGIAGMDRLNEPELLAFLRSL